MLLHLHDTLRRLAITQPLARRPQPACRCHPACTAGTPSAAALARFWRQLDSDMAHHSPRFDSLRSLLPIFLQHPETSTQMRESFTRPILTPAASPSWDGLGDDVWITILQMAGARATCSLAATNSTLSTMARCEGVWASHFARLDLGLLPFDVQREGPPAIGWLAAYRLCSDVLNCRRCTRSRHSMV